MAKARGLRGSKPNPLRERDRLRQEIQSCYDYYSQQTSYRQKAERLQGKLHRALADAESAAAKGKGSDAQLTEAQTRAANADDAYEKALAGANSALSSRKDLEYELEQLYSAYFEDFAMEAEKASKLADAALHEMVDAYRRAQEAWARAQVEWVPLCHAVRIAPMPPFPVDDYVLAPVIQGWKARPPGIELLELEPGEAVAEAAELEGLDVAG